MTITGIGSPSSSSTSFFHTHYHHQNTASRKGTYSVIKLLGLGLILYMIIGDINLKNIPHILSSSSLSFSLNYLNTPNIPSPYSFEGTLPWSECIKRFPGLLEEEIYVPLPDDLITDKTYIPQQSADIPIYVLAYNNPTFVQQMVEQIDCYGSYAVILNSGSTYQPMLDYMKKLETGPPSRSGIQHRVIHLDHNAGPRGAFTPGVFAEMPAFAAITDADIAFNPHLPPNFLIALANLTRLHRNKKVGFSLSIDNPDRFWPGIYGDGLTITGFESIWWKKRFTTNYCYRYNTHTKVSTPYTLDLYEASIDTTFAVYDVEQVRPTCRATTCHFFDGIRVANQFKGDHIPWTMNFTAKWNRQETMAAYGPPAKGSTISHKLREYGWLPPE